MARQKLSPIDWNSKSKGCFNIWKKWKTSKKLFILDLYGEAQIDLWSHKCTKY
jgi:hypothetical protein